MNTEPTRIKWYIHEPTGHAYRIDDEGTFIAAPLWANPDDHGGEIADWDASGEVEFDRIDNPGQAYAMRERLARALDYGTRPPFKVAVQEVPA